MPAGRLWPAGGGLGPGKDSLRPRRVLRSLPPPTWPPLGADAGGWGGRLYTIPRNLGFILKVAGSHERNVNRENDMFKSLFCSENNEKD